jgi:hypothetical protein
VRNVIWAGVVSLGLGSLLSAGTFTAYYGDVDGFGVGATSAIDALSSNAGPGEDPFTDMRLIGNSTAFLGPAFTPLATLTFGPLAGNITSVVLTMRMGGFAGTTSPVDGPNALVIDGTSIGTALFDGFTPVGDNASDNVETRSFTFSPGQFALFADGAIALNGTYLSENSGFGSFQVDYLQFVVTTDADAGQVPEPGTWVLAGAGLLGLGLVRRRRN